MKEIKMDYSEYEKMVETLKAQEEVIEELKKDAKVVLIEARHRGNPPFQWLHGDIPTIIATDNEAIEYLQKTFDYLAEGVKYHKIRLREDLMKDKEAAKEYCENNWWGFILNNLNPYRTK